MKNLLLYAGVLFLSIPSLLAQNLNEINGGLEDRRIIDGKKFHVMYYEYEIKKSVDEIWNEVAGNYVNVGDIAKIINESYCQSGDTTQGLGAARYCNIDFAGKEVKIKERITEFEDCGEHRSFTYEVYESEGFPAKVYNSWIVRTADDGKIYLANVFIFRAKPAMMSSIMGKKIGKLGALRNSVLTYKHYLETGEKKADPSIFSELYPKI